MSSLWRRVRAVLQRFPWFLPTASFVAGMLGFALIRRGEELARLVALAGLLGWFWLLVEPWVRQRLEQRHPRLGNFFVNLVSQSLQQELLFFSLPFLIGATHRDLGQIVFTTLVAVAAVLSSIDPVYERVIARRAARRMSFHAFCSWIAALVVLPMVLLVPLERALPISLVVVTAWLWLTLPLSLRSLPRRRSKVAWVAGMVGVPLLLWHVRAQVPAAGLVVHDARVTQQVENLEPGPPIRRVRREDLTLGVVAYAAIRAPTGLAQQVIFEWHHNGETERIAAEIRGGRAEGFRVYSRKLMFPPDSGGVWTVDLLTPQRQLLERLEFLVES